MGRTRVLVVEDSATIRRRLVEVLAADPELDVVGEAGDGERAFALCDALRPDVVTLDLMLPGATGLDATERIMAFCPTPILIVSAAANRRELFETYDALAAGAVEALEKPLGDEPDDRWERRLVATVKLVARIKVITHLRARLRMARPATGPAAAPEPRRPSGRARAVAVGASTGGPAAILELLRALPAGLDAPLLLVVHVGSLFAASFAEWLDAQSPYSVAFAREGERLDEVGARRALLAPPDRHLVLEDGHLRLTGDPERHSCRPAVDALFESLARELGPQAVGCLLTGMGRDGAAGLLALRRAGGRTIAQDEATSVVFGMPREAILLGAAEQVLPLGEIAPALAALARGDAPGGRG